MDWGESFSSFDLETKDDDEKEDEGDTNENRKNGSPPRGCILIFRYVELSRE
jgi:hypothetical protein